MLAWRQLNDLEETVTYDVIIRDGLWFDGTGNAPLTRTLGIRDGVVATVAAGALDETGCPEVVDAAGKWVVPGFIDVHTHYDAEVLLDPGLRESVRHGVTTVLLGNCSLSTVYANSEDAADLFSRVEAVPREFVLGALRDKSMLVSADAKSMPLAVHVFGLGTRVLNKLLGSQVRFQHLPVPFELYSDGIDLPVFEEFGAGTAALHLRDQLQRNELLADRSYRRSFRREFDRIKLGPSLWHRDFHDAVIVECPDKSLIGKSFGAIADERGLHPLDAFLDVLVDNGERNVRWTTIVANHRPNQLNKLAAEPSVHMGFSDAGAHLRNMAFYNFGLRLLKRARDADRAGQPFLSIERAVYRLTGELAEWFGIGAGTLRQGDRADFAVIDPTHLDESVDGYHEEAVPYYGGLRRMVNRNDATVVATGVGGTVVFRGGQFGGQFRDGYGQNVKSGRYLRAGELGAALSRSA